MNMKTKCSQGSNPPIKVCTYPITEGNNLNFARGSRTELSIFFLSLVNVISVPLNEDKNRNFARVSPTELSFVFFGFFGK